MLLRIGSLGDRLDIWGHQGFKLKTLLVFVFCDVMIHTFYHKSKLYANQCMQLHFDEIVDDRADQTLNNSNMWKKNVL